MIDINLDQTVQDRRSSITFFGKYILMNLALQYSFKYGIDYISTIVLE